MKKAVFFYSWKGFTRKVAEVIAEKMSAELIEIREAKERKGISGFLGGILEAIRKKHINIVFPMQKPEEYDIVFLMTPIWAGNPSPAIRTFVEKTNWADKKTVVVVTQGASGNSYTEKIKLFMENNQANVLSGIYFRDKTPEDAIREKIDELKRGIKDLGD